MFGEHLNQIRGLMQIYRYQNRFRHKPRNVAEHSWFVSKIAHGLATWEKYKFKNESVDIEKTMFLAINHDIIENYTGDILSTTKNLSQILKQELENVEATIFKTHIVNTIPKSWGESYLQVHEEMSKINTIESKLVKAGDLLDRVYECMEEIDLQNKNPYEDILIDDIKRLRNLNLMSVDYFLKYSIKDIGADKYIPDDIKEYLDGLDFSPYF